MIKKEEFYFDSRDGVHKLHAVKWSPEITMPVCIVHIVHGMAEHIERYDEFARFLVGKGIMVVGDDHLGHGKSVNEGEPYGYFCKDDAPGVLVQDEHRLKKTVQKLYPGIPYIILGHSMGSFITRNYMLRYGTDVDGVILCGTGMQSKFLLHVAKVLAAVQRVFCGQKHKSGLINAVAFGRYNRRIQNPKTHVDWLSRNEENVARYIEDPLCGFTFTVNGFAALFQLIRNLYDVEKLKKMPKELPVLFISGEEDPVGNYGKRVQHVYQSYKDIGMENVQIKLYPEDRHELLNEVDREVVYGDVYRWILQRIS